MIPAPFEYVRAGSLKEALQLLSADDGSKLLAGGHSLLPMMRFRLVASPRLIDISRVRELRGIEEAKKGARIGAGTTYREILDSRLLQERFPVLVEVTSNIGDLQVRNRGTLGGSLAHGDPNSDMPAVMLALDAEFNLRSKQGGRRKVPAREFFTGPFSTALRADEILVDIVLPGMPRNSGAAYVSYEQAASGYALAAACAVIGRKRRTIYHAVLTFTGVGETALLARAAEQLIDSKGEEAVVRAVADQALEGIEVPGDLHAPAEYRRHLATVAARQAILAAYERAGA